MGRSEAYGSRRRGLLAVVLALLVTTAGCEVFGYYRLRPATSAPTFALGDSVRPEDVDSVAAYVARLDFDTAKGAGDEQLLHHDPCPPCTHGPRATIQPEKGSYAVTEAELARGRVVARLINADTIAYDRYNLGSRDTVYWWVDRTTAGAWRSVFFTRRPARRFVVSELEFAPHAARAWWQGIAGWLWGSEEIAWVTCGDKGCCKSDGAELSER